jgi:endonuclease III
MLNRECLIIDKAKNIDDPIACSILSANTFDESVNTKWARFIETIKVHLKQTMGTIQDEIDRGQNEVETNIQ